MSVTDAAVPSPAQPDLVQRLRAWRLARFTPRTGDTADLLDEAAATIQALAERVRVLEPLARLGLKALDCSREGGDYDGGDIQDDANNLGVVIQAPVGPGNYCVDTEDENSNCLCAECEADVCYRDSPATVEARAALRAGQAGPDKGER